MSSRSPWQQRFDPILRNLEEVRRRAYRAPVGVDKLASYPVEVGCQHLARAWSDMFYPTKQACDVLRRLVEIAAAHAQMTYSDTGRFLSEVYEPARGFCNGTVWCLTGPSGCGKSQLVRALSRVLPEDSTVAVGNGHSPFPMRALWTFQMSVRSSLVDQIAPYAYEAPELCAKSGKIRELLERCRRNAFRSGVSLLVADEFQFVTLNSASNTLVTQYLMALGSISPPLVFVANYSLCHRLLARNQEDRRRLLSNPILLLPDDPEGADWTQQLTEMFSVAPNVFVIDPSRHAEAMHQLCGGLKGALRDLLVLSYRAACAAGRTVVTISDAEKAYRSVEFTVHRQDIQMMTDQIIAGAPKRGRHDLWCPLEVPAAYVADVTARNEVARREQLAREMLKSSLKPESKVILATATDEVVTSVARRRRTKAQLSAESLLENYEQVRSGLFPK